MDMKRHKFLIIAILNILIIVIAIVFLLRPQYELLGIARHDANLAENRYRNARRMEIAYENALFEIGQASYFEITHYTEFAFVLDKIVDLALANNLQQISFVANEPVLHEGFLDTIKEVQVRAEYAGLVNDLESFLHELTMVQIYSAQIHFGEEARLSLGFSIFAVDSHR